MPPVCYTCRIVSILHERSRLSTQGFGAAAARRSSMSHQPVSQMTVRRKTFSSAHKSKLTNSTASLDWEMFLMESRCAALTTIIPVVSRSDMSTNCRGYIHKPTTPTSHIHACGDISGSCFGDAGGSINATPIPNTLVDLISLTSTSRCGSCNVIVDTCPGICKAIRHFVLYQTTYQRRLRLDGSWKELIRLCNIR